MAAASATDKTLLPGTMAGEYRLGAKLGEGGMGVVYAGQHPVIGKRVAVKVLSSECASDPDLVRRFLEEARAVNKIGHPNIIDIFAFGQLPDGRQYFVMEFLDGQSLSDRLEKGELDRTELRRLLRQICSALEAAHREGIIHRDLKPENIWIATPKEEDSYAKLLDFGIAKLVDLDTAKITQTGAAMGSPQFMPPEQCMGRPVDRRADIYAMGVILYRIFTGRLPFEGKSLPELVYQQTTQTPVPPSRHRSVDPDIERVILDCLEKEPDRRPGTARELSERLDRAFATGRGRTATPVMDGRLMGGVSSIETTMPRVTDAERDSSRMVERVVGGERSGSGGVLAGAPSSASASGPVPVPVSRAFRTRVLLVGGGVLIVSVGAFIVSRGRRAGDEVKGIAQVAAPMQRPEESRPSEGRPPVRSKSLGPQVKPLPPPLGPNVAIRLRSVPPGARVVATADGSVLGKTPLDLTRPRGSGLLGIKLDLRGWKPVAADVPLWLDFDHSYDLEKLVATAQKTTAPAVPAIGSPPASAGPATAPPQARPLPDPFAAEPRSKRAVPIPSIAPTTPASPAASRSAQPQPRRPWSDPFVTEPTRKPTVPIPSATPPSPSPATPPSMPRPTEPAKKMPLRI